MNKNIVIVLAGGFLIALLVALMVNAALTGSKKDDVKEVKKIQILVAAKDLSVGKELVEGDLKWQTWPEDSVFMGAVIRDGEQKPNDVIDGKLLRSMVEGQPVHTNILTEEDKGDFLSANVSKGMRAVGVEVKKHVVADRLIKPGDYVDVIVTYRVRVNTRNNPDAQSLVSRHASETVIENVRILAIDTNDMKAVDEAEKGKGKKKKTSRKAIVTLEVNPDNAEKLVLADKMGDIGFALRALGDQETPQGDKQTTDVGMSQVMTKLSNMNSTSSTVRIFNGNQIQEVRGRSLQSDAESNVDFSFEDEPLPSQTIIIDPAAIGGFSNEQ
jgi:pilus assembly protein CpaB